MASVVRIRDTRVECGGGRAAALGVCAVARGAILLEHGFARGDISRWELVSVHGRIVLLRGDDTDENKQSEELKGAAGDHGLLHVRCPNAQT